MLTRSNAEKEARSLAISEGLRMVVTENPYSEHQLANHCEPPENFNYFPASAAHIFKFETVLLELEAWTGEAWTPVPAFGCWVKRERPAVFVTPDRGDPNATIELTAPEPGFLEALNSLWGTNYRESEFSGR